MLQGLKVDSLLDNVDHWMTQVDSEDVRMDPCATGLGLLSIAPKCMGSRALRSLSGESQQVSDSQLALGSNMITCLG